MLLSGATPPTAARPRLMLSPDEVRTSWSAWTEAPLARGGLADLTTPGGAGGGGGRDEEVVLGIVAEREGDGGTKIGGNPVAAVVVLALEVDVDAVDLLLSTRRREAVLNCARLERDGEGRIMTGLLLGTCRCELSPSGLRPRWSSVGRSSSEWPRRSSRAELVG